MEKKLLAVFGLVAAAVLVSGCTATGGDNGGGATSLLWCTEENMLGSYQFPSEYGTLELLGATLYQGQAACQVRYSYSSTEGSITIDYYFLDEEGNNFWANMAIPGYGQWTVHIVDDDCVAGDCQYWSY